MLRRRIEYSTFLIKRHWPKLFDVINTVAHYCVRLRFGRAIAAARNVSAITGTCHDLEAEIRPLSPVDAPVLCRFMEGLPSSRLEYFRPHPFDLSALARILGSPAFMTYGLFVAGKMQGYSLLKVSPSKSAFVGLILHPDMGGLGLGKFLVAHLYWQATCAGLRTCSTISRKNYASLQAHRAVAEFEIIAELPDGYVMIEFPIQPVNKPELKIPL